MSDSAYTFLQTGVTESQLLANFRAYANDPAATAEQMYAALNAQQVRARVSVPLTAGKGSWTFSRPFLTGVTPIVQVTVETPDTTMYTYDAKVVDGSVTSTGCVIQVNRLLASQTLGATLAELLGSVVRFFQPATGTVTVNCSAAVPA